MFFEVRLLLGGVGAAGTGEVGLLGDEVALEGGVSAEGTLARVSLPAEVAPELLVDPCGVSTTESPGVGSPWKLQETAQRQDR